MRNNLAGRKFGKLTALNYSYNPKNQRSYWLCLCECGNIKLVQAVYLSNGHTKSCGCLRGEASVKHGHTRHGRHTPTWHTWGSMVKRCTNPNSKDYPDYGGRGIGVCERWLDFSKFVEDMGVKPTGLTLGRIKNEEGYSKDNCRWETAEEQANNKRNNHRIEINGKTKTASQWAREFGLQPDLVFLRIRRGWSAFEAVTTPVR